MPRRNLAKKQQLLLGRIRALGPVLRGSVAEVHLTCGKKNCRCQRGLRHRAFYLSYRFQGETRVVHLPAHRVAEAQEFQQNWRRLQHLLEELTDVQVALWKEVSDGQENAYRRQARREKDKKGSTEKRKATRPATRKKAPGKVEDETHDRGAGRRNPQGRSRRTR
jgi:hypothetical protein